MIGLDTNVLVRYITQDDPVQARKASAEIEQAASRDEPMFIGLIVLCELVWALEFAYRYPRQRVAAVLERIIQTAEFRFSDRDLLMRALAGYQRGRGDFADYCIGRQSERGGCRHTVTFDRGVKNEPLFRVL